VRGTYALSRGMGLELLLAEEPGTTTRYEEMFLAYATGLMSARPGNHGPPEGRHPMTTTTSTSTPSSQAERLRALIAHAVAASPWYRDLLGPDAAGGDVPLSELPTLSKATLMDNFDRVVTDSRLLDELAVWLGTCLRGLASWGLGPGTRLAGIGSPSPLHISNQLYAVLLAGPVTVHPFQLRAPFLELLEVRQYQVVHDPAGLHVAVVLREDAPADTPARVRAALTGELRAAGAVPPPIEVTPVPGIERDPGHGAKFKLVRSRPAPPP
jgi:hypothetical protein